MKGILIVLILALLPCAIVAQQNKIIRTEYQKYSAQEDKLVPSSKTLYQYDTNNNEISTQAYYWNKDSLKYILSFSSSKTYSPSNKILSNKTLRFSRYNDKVQIDSFFYKYDQFELLTYLFHLETYDSYKKKVEKFYSSGRIDSTLSSGSSSPNTWEINEKRYYTHTGTKTSTSKFFLSDNNWVLIGNTVLDTDQYYRSLWTNISDIAEEEMYITRYDSFDNIILYQHFVKHSLSDTLELKSETVVTNTYSPSNKLIESSSVDNSYENGQIAFTYQTKNQYTYYCDDILKKQKSFSREKLKGIENFFYQKGINCDSDQEATILIHPNPFYEVIDLSGTALEYEKVTINIYNTIGQNLFSKTIQERTRNARVAIPGLAKGIYLATFQWNNHLITKKLVKN